MSSIYAAINTFPEKAIYCPRPEMEVLTAPKPTFPCADSITQENKWGNEYITPLASNLDD